MPEYGFEHPVGPPVMEEPAVAVDIVNQTHAPERRCFPLPAMGGVGCGWTTAISMWAMAIGLAVWTRFGPAYQSSELFKRFDWPQWAVIKRVLGIGLPIGIAVFAESSIFAVIALLIGSLGATVVAGHQIALNVSSLVFMIPYSLGMAVTVRVLLDHLVQAAGDRVGAARLPGDAVRLRDARGARRAAAHRRGERHPPALVRRPRPAGFKPQVRGARLAP